MKTIFADTSYWIALVDPEDELHDRAHEVTASLEGGESLHYLTTEMVLAEFMNGLADVHIRNVAVAYVLFLRKSPTATILPQTPEQFETAFDVYATRTDKEWGITDCASYQAMTEHQIYEALTYDQHFQQMGFAALLR